MDLTFPFRSFNLFSTVCHVTEDGATPESERAADVEEAKIEEVLYTSRSCASATLRETGVRVY